jgi:redox-sensitive bicupin YhaK (pirin superfamily)
MIKVEQGSQLTLPPAAALQLVFVYMGEGEVDGKKLMKESAFRLEPGQQAVLSSRSSLEALHLILPGL